MIFAHHNVVFQLSTVLNVQASFGSSVPSRLGKKKYLGEMPGSTYGGGLSPKCV